MRRLGPPIGHTLCVVAYREVHSDYRFLHFQGVVLQAKLPVESTLKTGDVTLTLRARITRLLTVRHFELTMPVVGASRLR